MRPTFPQLLFVALLAILSPSSWAITYADWIASYGLTGVNALTTADPDGDTLPNLLEYALADCDPANPATGQADYARLPKMVFGQRSGNGLPSTNPYNITYSGLTPPPTGTFHFGLRYRPRPGTEALRIEALYSRDLVTGWYGGRNAFVVSPETPIVGDAIQWFLEAYTLPTYYTAQKHFLRLSCSPWANAPTSTIPVGGPQLYGAPAQGLLVLAPVTQPRALEGTGSESTLNILDRTIRRVTAATTVTDFYWRWDPLGSNTQPVVLQRTSSNTGVLLPSPDNPYVWQWQGNGTAILTLNTSTSSYTTTVTASTTTPQNVDTVTGFVSGSLRAHLVSQIDPLIASGGAGEKLRIFTAQDHEAGIYVRNASCWAAPYVGQLTCISPWNSQGGPYLAGVLVSPRHVLFATHYAAGAGATMRFIAADNTIVTRTLTATAPLPGYANYYPDITVGVLDSDVPGTIAYARILPDDWPAKLPTLTGTTAADTLLVPGLGLDQEEKALVSDLSGMASSVQFSQPVDSKRRSFYEEKIGGDSGNPAFLIINGQLVLVTCWTYGGGGSGTSVHHQKAAINTLMTTLGGGYQLTPADLSGFPSY